ncbi:hypothetical protein BH10PSE7_BH10PSE7_44050 [soil metagenome]
MPSVSAMERLLKFEETAAPAIHRRRFYRRLGRHALFAAIVVVIALALGMVGYIGFEGMTFVDAFLNAAMILSGMGPVGTLHTTGGKIFAGVYALFSGLLIFGIAGLVLAPVFHRVLYRFHVEDSKNEKRDEI